MERGQQLETLIDLSLEKAEELLLLQLDRGDDNFPKIASMQKDLVVSLINTGVKVDENRFRKKSTEAVTEILAQLLDRERELGRPIVEAEVKRLN